MDIEYKGGNSVVIATKKATVVVDPHLAPLGVKDIVVKDAVQLITTKDAGVQTPQRIIIDGPGEYEVADISIKGVIASRHIDIGDAKKATMFTIDSGEVRVAVLGHVRADINDLQLEELGTIDVLIIPVGGGGYTLDDVEATALTRRINPKVVIPTHFEDKALTYEVPQSTLEGFIKAMGVPHEVMPKLKIKGGALPEALTIIELTRTT